MPHLRFPVPRIGDVFIPLDDRLVSFWETLCNKLRKEDVQYTLITIIAGACVVVTAISIFRYVRASRAQSTKKRTPMVPRRQPSAYLPSQEIDKVGQEVRKRKPDIAPPVDAAASSTTVQRTNFPKDPYAPLSPTAPREPVSKRRG